MKTDFAHFTEYMALACVVAVLTACAPQQQADSWNSYYYGTGKTDNDYNYSLPPGSAIEDDVMPGYGT